VNISSYKSRDKVC